MYENMIQYGVCAYQTIGITEARLEYAIVYIIYFCHEDFLIFYNILI